MGSSASKGAAKTASKLSATNSARKYPTRTPPPPPPKSQSNSPAVSSRAQAVTANRGPGSNPENRAREGRDGAEPHHGLDSIDSNAALNERMRKLGPVTPNPTQSNSSTFNTSQPSAHSQDPSLSASQFQPSASSPSQSIFPARENPAVSLLTARFRLAEEADKEFAEVGRRGAAGRQHLDVETLRHVLILRDKGIDAVEIERRMGLREGVVARLGGKGVVSAVD